MRYIFFISYLLLWAACANVSMPTGGPRDKTPPELVSSTPANNEKNYTGKTIELTFNEDIKLKDPKEEILIVPSIGKKTLFTVRKRKLIIEPELTWLTNTTYSINFRDGVQDLTEGNPAENLRLAFSTGSTIDSLYIKGSVSNIFTEKIPEKITIAIYEQDTFDIFKHTPMYFTKSDKEGQFNIPNLKSSDYYIYAFDDKNKNLKIDSKTEKFGFISKPIKLTNSEDSINISLLMVDSRPLTITNIRHTDKTSRIRFNKQLDSIKIKDIKRTQAIPSYGTDKSELIFYTYLPKGDSLPVTLQAKDSIGQTIDTVAYIKQGEIKTSAETLKTKELEADYNLNSKTFTYKFSYNKPVSQVNYDSLLIIYDSLNVKRLQPDNIIVDSLLNEITIHAVVETPTINPEVKTKPKPPELVIGKGAFISIEQDTSRSVKKLIKIPKEEDLGLVSIKVETTQKNFIVQLTSNDGKVIESLYNIKEYTFKNLEPREYRIQIIIDENKNGKWDPGNFYRRSEPEKVILYKSEEDKYSFPLRANWEYGPLLIKF